MFAPDVWGHPLRQFHYGAPTACAHIAMLALLLASAAFHAPMGGVQHLSVMRTGSPAVMQERFWERDDWKKSQKLQTRKTFGGGKAGKPGWTNTFTPPAPVQKRARPAPAAPRPRPVANRGPAPTPAQAFEKNFAPLYVPSREGVRRPDLRDINTRKKK